jgi:hypothetical protein
VVTYLQSRGIDKQLILDCIDRGSLYESAKWHQCVFVGRDDNGKTRYASLRGTIGDFKIDADGSDKKFGFVIPPTNGNDNTATAFKCNLVIAFESAVDALSHQTIYPNLNCWRLSLGGTYLPALTNFIERHREVKSVIIGTDNDAAGNTAAANIAELKGVSVYRLLPPDGKKDWNDALIAIINEPRIALSSQYKTAKPVLYNQPITTKTSLLKRLESAKATVSERNLLSGRERARQAQAGHERVVQEWAGQEGAADEKAVLNAKKPLSGRERIGGIECL